MKRRKLIAAALSGYFLGNAVRANDLPGESAEAESRRGIDIAVIGAGAAGLSAAVSAAEAAAAAGRRLKITVFEKNAEPGGDTLISGGYFNAVDPRRQKPMGIEDSAEIFAAQMLRAGKGFADPALVRILAEGSEDALRWLESLGLSFLPKVVQIFGGSFPRAHKPLLPSGRAYLRALTQAAFAAGISVRTHARAESLLLRAGRIAGIVISQNGNSRTIPARAVIIASGGFGASASLVAAYAPEAAGLPFDTQPGSTGEMLLAARDAGAELVNMSFVECIPGSRRDIPYRIRLDYIPGRIIMVGKNGRRLVEETGERSEIAEGIMAADGPVWTVCGQDAVEALDLSSQKTLYRALYAGEAWRAQTPEELAILTGITPDGLLRTLSEEPARSRIAQRPLWAAAVHLRIHATLGGIRISPKAQVLTPSGLALPGLWAAGAATGGIHGRNRMGGNGINTAVVFGRIAGREAAKACL